MTCAPPVATEVTDAALRAQLHLALCSVWSTSGDASAVAEADTILASPGLPERIYAAAAQSRLLALITPIRPESTTS
jgi:hypothetical protein